MISRFLKVDVVLEDLIALGKELKIVTMDEFKWSKGFYNRYLFLTIANSLAITFKIVWFGGRGHLF